MRFIKTFSAIVAAFAGFFLCASAQAQFDYTTNNGTITITKYTGQGGAVTIPDTISGLPVATIGTNAFYRCDSLTNITIGTSVTSIENSAFSSCHSLINVTIPNSLCSIGIYAFFWCSSLTNMTIPNGVTNIGSGAFSQCSNLSKITIPNSVISIGNNAFSFCSSLASITIPNSVVSIGSCAFAPCPNLEAIAVNENNSTYSSLAGVLFDKSQATLIQYPGSQSRIYTVPNSVTRIGDSAFSDCYSLASVTIPNSVTNIGDGTFHRCCSLTNVTLPNNLTNIGDGMFFACIRLNSVTIPNSVTRIGGSAFYYCENLTNVTIPNTVTTLGDAAFLDCISLTHIYFQGDAPSLERHLCFNGSNATIYYLPGTTGWGTTYGSRPTALWTPLVQTTDATFGVRSNQFGFNINWASGQTVVVEACTNPVNPTWSALQTKTLTDDSFYFSDPEWTNYPTRIYRLRVP